ncbi:chromosome segregation ATPase [Methylomonas methanica]|uniref:Chromosome segregation ATPase-like protein n=1 Tax=Methylomonas methanica (strain DSM 25384 / MC09) TaxID=857087 RepID=F9ZV93_METMM|nr:chromosome segregation ATPase [Methylomonas methanica]AEG00703.1 chromosome segregation ATPase-like protein [Methylomonas methanica MC09]
MGTDKNSEVEAVLVEREAAVVAREKQAHADRQSIEEQKSKLTEREKAVTIAEQNRDAGFADDRAALNHELRDKRAQAEAEISNFRAKKLSEIDDEIAKLKTERLDDISNAENVERERIRVEIAKEREAWTKQQDDTRKQLNTERTEFEKQRGALSVLQSELEGRKIELEGAERMLERKEQRLEQQWQRRNEQLQDEVDEQIRERRKSLEAAEANIKVENIRLREALHVQTGLVSAFEQLKQQLGGKDPAEILRALNSQTDELKRLREELATRPTEEMRERYQTLESEARNQKMRADELERQIASNEAAVAEIGDLRRQNSELNAENKSLAQRASIFEGAANEAQSELNRLRAAYERPAEVAARYKEIEMPHISVDKVKEPVKHDIDEMTWLTGIGNACDTYGLHFNPRILKAFHTALKTAEWSPLTVLAGVSGTGKSELPRLYSHFGGIYFEPLSVQPNWDSQESMLGFFNSIDNKFDAQPVLRFLAQSQIPGHEKYEQTIRRWQEMSPDTITLDPEKAKKLIDALKLADYPGLQDAVCLVLLDEMNLAHPELYFADFLSKLELRRGRKGGDVPVLPVKIGAGMSPYQLPLGRNVLWTGTMNQDETTKSLSDKVLDRSIIINFPRPTELKRRLKLAPLDDKNCSPALHKTSWQSWVAQGSDFSDDQVKPFKEFIEGMNASLSVTGRALGHRVWQSIEYYMANYPDVRAAQRAKDKDSLAKAMHIAFEDQLVQKVMPKLRGIDTRGKSKTECLDKILGQIVTGIGGNKFNLAEDFDLACYLGYGQFIWQSANYLNVGDTDVNGKYMTAQASDGNEEPHPLFMINEPDMAKRRKAWNAKTPEQRDELSDQLEANDKAGRIPR